MSNHHPESEKPGWFERKGNTQKILWALYVVSAVLLIVDFVLWFSKVDKHPYLKWETWPGFYAAFGFVSCVVLVFGAKFILRPITKRREDFYLSKNQKGENDA